LSYYSITEFLKFSNPLLVHNQIEGANIGNQPTEYHKQYRPNKMSSADKQSKVAAAATSLNSQKLSL
jgi:hypothetical protein